MEATLQRLEGPVAEAAEPSSPERLFQITSPNVQETPSQALGRKLANAGLNSVPSGVGLSDCTAIGNKLTGRRSKCIAAFPVIPKCRIPGAILRSAHVICFEYWLKGLSFKCDGHFGLLGKTWEQVLDNKPFFPDFSFPIKMCVTYATLSCLDVLR